MTKRLKMHCDEFRRIVEIPAKQAREYEKTELSAFATHLSQQAAEAQKIEQLLEKRNGAIACGAKYVDEFGNLQSIVVCSAGVDCPLKFGQ